MIRDYEKGVHETLDVTIVNAGSSKNALKADSIFSNAFYDFTLYSDSAYTIPISSSAYESSTIDSYYTSSEIGFIDETIYSEYRVLDPTYQTGTIYARCESIGIYTSGAAVGQDYITIDADYAYTSSPYAFMTCLVIEDGLTADITITVTDGGGDERNQFKVINKDTVYSVFVLDSVTARRVWQVLPLRKELFYVDGALYHGSGFGLAFKATGSPAATPESSLNEDVVNGSHYRTINNLSTAYQTSDIYIYDRSVINYSNTANSGGSVNRWNPSGTQFDSNSTSYDNYEEIWKLYD